MEKKENLTALRERKRALTLSEWSSIFCEMKHVKSARGAKQGTRDTAKRKSLFLCVMGDWKCFDLRNNHGLGRIELEQRVLDRI